MTIIALFHLAACGMFTDFNTEAAKDPFMPPAPRLIVDEPKDWREDYVAGSVVEITESNLDEVWKQFSKMPRPATFDDTVTAMIHRGLCVCQSTPVAPSGSSQPGSRATFSITGCKDISNHDGKWWIGTLAPTNLTMSSSAEGVAFAGNFYADNPACSDT